MKDGMFNPFFYGYDEIESITIVSIADSDPISVAYGTAFGSLSLPSTVVATLSDGTTPSLSVTWSNAGYDGNASDTYDILGDVTLPPGVTNPFLIQGHIQVTVQEQIFTEVKTVQGFAVWTVPSGVEEITSVEVIGAGASGGSVFNVTRAPGGGGGAYALKNAISVTSGQLIPYYIAHSHLAPLPSSGDLEGEDGRDTWFGPVVSSGLNILSGEGAPGGGVGVDGDYYSDVLTSNFYGPKAAGAWPASSGSAFVKASGGNKGTGFAPGVGGQGGLTADSIGDTINEGGDGIAAPASRGGAGGAAGGPSGAGANATTTGGTNSVGGVGIAPAGSGGNGGATNGSAATDYGGGGPGARNTVDDTVTRGGEGKQGWGRVIYSGSDVPPPEPGDVHMFAIWGQSNACSPGNGSPGSPYTGPLDSKIFINSTTGYQALEYGVNNNPGGSPTGLGPELSLAVSVAVMAPGETYFQKKSQSGTSMYNHWNVANNSTGRSAVSSLRSALNYLQDQGKVIRTITVVFVQAEADMGATNPNGPVAANVQVEYKAKEADLIKYTIDELELDGFDLDVAIELHWIDVRLGDVYGGSIDTTFKDVINAAKDDLMANFATDFPSYASKFAGGHTINTDGLGRFDFIHYTTTSEIEIGSDCGSTVTWI
jgi:hypothetical protein